jgi:hypothetical protein
MPNRNGAPPGTGVGYCPCCTPAQEDGEGADTTGPEPELPEGADAEDEPPSTPMASARTKAKEPARTIPLLKAVDPWGMIFCREYELASDRAEWAGPDVVPCPRIWIPVLRFEIQRRQIGRPSGEVTLPIIYSTGPFSDPNCQGMSKLTSLSGLVPPARIVLGRSDHIIGLESFLGRNPAHANI